jgi:hypothetical protein
MSIRLVQIQNDTKRRVALVKEPTLVVLDRVNTIYQLATFLADGEHPLSEYVGKLTTAEVLDYDSVYEGKSEWRLLPPIDHPNDLARCMVSGTGLTHLGSAKNRQAMHGDAVKEMTDSMKMFQWGVEGGKPAAGKIGIAPEWFYKGNGGIIRGHGEAITMPPFAEDGGEEAEIVGLYIIAPNGNPIRIGMAQGNEFSDHVFEKKNYLNLAGSKLRECSIGPELVIDADFTSVSGESRIERGGQTIWSKEVRTGESEMCHSLANIEHHHFKFPAHRRPGDVHIHYYGAHSLSFGDGIRCADGDMMIVRWDGFGRALKNPLRRDTQPNELVGVTPLK